MVGVSPTRALSIAAAICLSAALWPLPAAAETPAVVREAVTRVERARERAAAAQRLLDDAVAAYERDRSLYERLVQQRAATQARIEQVRAGLHARGDDFAEQVARAYMYLEADDEVVLGRLALQGRDAGAAMHLAALREQLAARGAVEVGDLRRVESSLADLLYQQRVIERGAAAALVQRRASAAALNRALAVAQARSSTAGRALTAARDRVRARRAQLRRQSERRRAAVRRRAQLRQSVRRRAEALQRQERRERDSLRDLGVRLDEARSLVLRLEQARRLRAARRVEQARRRALRERARRLEDLRRLRRARRHAERVGAMPLPAVGAAVAGRVCPVGRPVSFTDTWGAPRSGGRSHEGVDMFARKGTPVYAVADGIATDVYSSSLGGLAIGFDDDRGDHYYYAHLSAQLVDDGERVRAGELIGRVGNTGNAVSTPPHLHWEYHPANDGPVNPTPLTERLCGD